MRIVLMVFIVLCLLAVPGLGQGVIHGNGDPRAQKPTPNCADKRFYVDDSSGKMYIASQGSPCAWDDPSSWQSTMAQMIYFEDFLRLPSGVDFGQTSGKSVSGNWWFSDNAGNMSSIAMGSDGHSWIYRSQYPSGSDTIACDTYSGSWLRNDELYYFGPSTSGTIRKGGITIQLDRLSGVSFNFGICNPVNSSDGGGCATGTTDIDPGLTFYYKKTGTAGDTGANWKIGVTGSDGTHEDISTSVPVTTFPTALSWEYLLGTLSNGRAINFYINGVLVGSSMKTFTLPMESLLGACSITETAVNVTFSKQWYSETRASTAGATPVLNKTVVVKGSAGSNCNLVIENGTIISTTCP